jgi:hypothetical protein
VAAQINHCAYDHVVEHISQTTGGKIAKRQCMSLVQDMAQDFDAYYLKNRYKTTEPTKDLLVLTFDGKGIVTARMHEKEGKKISKVKFALKCRREKRP